MHDCQLLIADDEPEVARFVTTVATDCGYRTTTVCTAETLQQELTRADLTHIILDLKMPGLDGIQALRHLAQAHSKAKVVIFSGTDLKIREAARRLGSELGLEMAGLLNKPVRLGELRALLVAMRPTDILPTADEIAEAIANDEMFLEFQPKIALPSRGLDGVEALVRWKAGDGRTRPPGEFLPVIEDTPLMGVLTWVVVDAALGQMADWNAVGLECPVSINLSAVNLSQLDFADRLAQTCESRGVSPSLITLELTETAAIRDQLSSMDILTRLRLKGFDLSIDDFGTGYSSIAQLHRLPFCELKIDRSFVKELGTSRDAEVIVKAIIDLARNLGLKACAEGVESEAALDTLQQLGCDRAQGFHIGRPMLGGVIPRWATPRQGGTVVELPGASASQR